MAAPGTQAATAARWIADLRRHPAGLLLVVQLLGLFLYPLMEATDVGRALFGTFGIVVLALAVWVVNRSPSINWIAWLLAVPAVVLSLAATWGGQSQWLVWAHLLEGALYFYAAAGLIVYMLRDQRVTRDELFAAGATFTLLAWGFAFAYSVCQAWYPDSFLAAVTPGEPRTWMELLFLSFTTLSATGLGDVIPVSPPARALAMLEMFCGVMYMALVLSRLIGLSLLRADKR
ncbi:MAG: potassium channel family protein [Luteimonas sp.]